MAPLADHQVYRYPFASHLSPQDDAAILRLATFSNQDSASPYFFQGRLTNPRRTADLLRGLMQIVQARFHVPAAMLQRILTEADPVVTSNDDRLRFEGFSACCGAYVRIDMLPESLDGETFGRGTTNVDFNQPMLSALAKIKAGDEVSIAVGADKVVLQQRETEVVEKKVKLPLRWLRGFVEVQAVQSRMKLVHQIDAIHAVRFFRSLPRIKTNRRSTWVAKSGQGLRLSQIQSPHSLKIGGLERLRVLESLSRDAESLSVYADESTGASAWVLTFTDCRFHLVVSPEVWRGFSGEGQALEALATADKTTIPIVQSKLKWQSIVDLEQLAKSTKLSPASIDAALKTLGARGLVGFDLAESTYFHREMPFDVSMIEKLQPRLRAARKLIDQNNVRIGKKTTNTCEVLVQSADVQHRVVLKSGKSPSWKCTCPWFAKHDNSRGPCKHILAAQILIEELALENN